MVPLVVPLLLHGCLALQVSVTSRPPVAGCRDAVPGERCHAALAWAGERGAREHPDWFPGDAGQYTARDFQSLLHQLGVAQCTQPCSPGSSERQPHEAGLLQSGAAHVHGFDAAEYTAELEASLQSGAAQAHGFHAADYTAELEELMDTTRSPGVAADRPAQAPGPAAAANESDCEDAAQGSLCHHSVTWLRETGFGKHPEWYPGLSKDTPFQIVQMMLHSLGKGQCKKPCEKADPSRRLEVQPDGPNSSEAVALPPHQGCGDAAKGDWCSMSIQWLRSFGFGEHPDWYPSLGRGSTDREVQAVLHRQGKVGCPEPCPERLGRGSSAEPPAATPAAPPQQREEAVAAAAAAAEPPRAAQPACSDAEEGSACYNEVVAQLEGVKDHPERYPGITNASSFKQVQGSLFDHMKANCTRPCPSVHSKKVLAKDGSKVKKPFEDMTVEELKAYMDGKWDGMVPTSAVHIAEAAAEDFVENASEPKPWAPEEASTAKGATETAAMNSSVLEPRMPENTANVDEETAIRGWPREVNSSEELEPLPRVPEEANADEETAVRGWPRAVNSSQLEPRVPEKADIDEETAVRGWPREVNSSELEPRVPEKADIDEETTVRGWPRKSQLSEEVPGPGDTNTSVVIGPGQEGSVPKTRGARGGPVGGIVEGAAETAAVNSSETEPRVQEEEEEEEEEAVYEENDTDTRVVSGPDDTNTSVVQEGSAPRTWGARGGPAGRIAEGVKKTIAVNSSEPKPRAAEEALPVEDDMETHAERVEGIAEPSTTEAAAEQPEPGAPDEASAAESAAAVAVVDSAPLPEVEAEPPTDGAAPEEPAPGAAPGAPGALGAGPPEAAASAQPAPDDEPLPLVGGSDAEADVGGIDAAEGPAGEAGARVPREETDAAPEADELKAELERLRAENEALRLRAESEKLRAENEAARPESPRAKSTPLQRGHSHASHLVEEQGNFSQPADEQSIAGEPSEEQGSAAQQPAEEQSSAAQPAEEQSAAQPAEELGSAAQPLWPAEEQRNASQPAEERSSAARPANEQSDADEPTEDESAASPPAERVDRADIEVVSPEPLPVVAGEEEVHSSAEVADEISEEPPTGMAVSTTLGDTLAEVSSGIREDLPKEVPASTTHAETLAEMESRIREDVLKQITFSTTSTENPAEKANQEFLKEIMESRIKEDVLKQITFSTTSTENPAEKANREFLKEIMENRIKEDVLKQITFSTTSTENPAEKANHIREEREELLKEMESRIREVVRNEVSTTPAETSAVVASATREELPKAVSVSTTPEETIAEMESRIRKELGQTALTETPAEMESRIRQEVLRGMTASTMSVDTPSRVESRTREDLLKETAAETTASPETQDEMTASMRAEVLRELEENSQRQKQKMEDDVRQELIGEISKDEHVDMSGNEEDRA